MNTKEAIEIMKRIYYCDVAGKIKPDDIEKVFECLEEGEKYKKIVEEIDERLIPGKVSIVECPDHTNMGELSTLEFIRLIIKDIKEKYFPKEDKTTSLHLTVTGANDDIDRLYKWVDKLEDFMRDKDMGFVLSWEDEDEDKSRVKMG